MLIVLSLLAGAALVLLALVLKTRLLDFLAQTPADYAAKRPEFDIRTHLNGPMLCEGVIYGPTGRVASRFVADFLITWEGDTGLMQEEFRYDSGAVQRRHWNLTVAANGSIRAEAPDVMGTGTGRQSGASVLLCYRIRLPDESGGHLLDVTDWMYLIENGTIMNRSQFRKYGIKVAELVATMRKVPQ